MTITISKKKIFEDMKQISTILLVTLIVLITKISCQTSPCPDVFQYQSDGQNDFGIITIPPPAEGTTVLEVKIGSRFRGPTSSRTSGDLNLLKGTNTSMYDAMDGKPVQYILKFPTSQQLPNIEYIRLNYTEICKGPKVTNVNRFNTYQLNFTFFTYIEYTPGITEVYNIPKNPSNFPTFYPNSIQNPTRITRPKSSFNSFPPPTQIPPLAPLKPSDASPASLINGSPMGSAPFTCGNQPLQLSQRTVNGEAVNVGEYPWLVALFHFKERRTEYKCGANLISNRHVITAAHCITQQFRVYLELGRHDITNPYEDSYVLRVSLEIIPHPDYVSGAHGDLALIIIEPVQFTPKIRPICLWAPDTNQDYVLRKGIVTGWGRVESDGELSPIPRKATVQKVSLDMCRNSHKKLRDVATDKTFCAGGQNTGPCHGDSGGGFYSYIPENNVWYLRGIISTGLGSDFVCSLEEYTVYANLDYYLDWLHTIMNKN